jgi:hypothetical protein
MAANAAGQTITGNAPAMDAPQVSVGRVAFDSTSITATDYAEYTTGFKPRYVRFENLTDRIAVEWWEGMAADTCIKTAAAGTKTIETTNKGVTVTANTFQISQNATLAVIAASKTCTWFAVG